MAEPQRAEDRETAAERMERPSHAATRGALHDWIESSRFPASGAGEPQLLRHGLQDGRSPWAPSASAPVAAENGSFPPAVIALLPESEINELRSRWNEIQAEFVEQPRHSIQEAEKLIARAMARLEEAFVNERASLEKQWQSGDKISTDELRIAFKRYRAFFSRLINAA